MKKSTLLPSFLLAFASILFIYSQLPVYMYPGEFIRPLTIVWSVLLVLILPAYWIAGDWKWAGLLLVVIVLGLFSNAVFSYAYFISIFSILALLWGWLKYFSKTNFGIEHVYIVLNSVSLVIIFSTFPSLYAMVKTIPPSYYGNAWDTVNSRRYLTLSTDTGANPDIYFIVLDGYGRSDILHNLYGFDNSEFIDGLRDIGFVVPEKSRTNYPRTALSITSILNANYIGDFVPHLENADSRWLMSPWLDHNLVRNSLERIGYSSVSISTNWSITDNPTTDYYFKSHPIILSEFDRYFLNATPLRALSPFLQELASVPTHEAHRQSQLNNFSVLTEVADISGPKFVFAHIILPHPPFVFSSDGTPIDPGYRFSFFDANDFPGSTDQYLEQYVDQVQFLNSQLEMVIESILENSTTPPIIILQADHGPRLFTNYRSAEDTCLAESFSTFSAYYLPSTDPAKIPDDITSVNVFRIVLNEFFNADLPLLRNAQYYPGYGPGYYSFEEVTQKVDNQENCRKN